MSHRDHKEPNDFSRKIRGEGTAGFSTGTRPDVAKIGVKAPPAATPPGNNRPRSGAHPDNPAPCRLGDRILTGLAIMSLGMLIVGAMGAYLSNESQHVSTTTRTEPGAASLPQDSDETRFGNLEKRLTDVNDLYDKRFHALESRLAQTIDPYEARLSNMERRMEQANDPNEARLRDVESRLEQLNAPYQEARLQAVEHRLEQAYTPNAAALQDLGNRLGQGYAGYEARLRELESRLMQIQVPYEERLRDLEQRLTYAAARLDYLSAEMESLNRNSNAIIEANATLRADPPAAMPVAASRDVSVNGTDPPWLPPAPATKDAAVAPATGLVDRDTGIPVATAPETPPDSAVPSAASPAPTDVAPGEPVAGMAEIPGADDVIVPAPQTVIAQPEAPRTQDKPVEPARQSRQESPPRQTGTGDWVINIASYASESIAARKLADFNRKGVAAEQVAATVNGKTIYRVRIAGFDTRKSATVRAETIREQLGLKETWVTKQ